MRSAARKRRNNNVALSPPGPSASRAAPFIILGVGLLIGLLGGAVVFIGAPSFLLPAPALNSSGPTSTPAPAAVVGAPAPDFTLKNLNGDNVTLSELRGQVVLINFWATWCGPCRAEMPAIQRRYDALKDQGFTVLAVNDDEAEQDVQAFAQAYELTFPILLDPGESVVGLYRVLAFPTTFFVDPQGVIQKLHIGALTESALDQYLTDLGLTP